MANLSPTSNRRGFTLVELVIVMVISCCLAALAIPRYSSAMQDYRADAAANQVAADLNYARTSAMVSSSSRTISFSVSGGTYTISNETSLTSPSGSYLINLSQRPFHASLKTVNFGGSASLSFNGYGIPTSSGSIVVQSGTTTRTISLSADSGIASVQ